MRLWTTKLVRPCIDTRCGIESGRERLRQSLPALGCRLRRRCHRPLQAQPAAPAAGWAARSPRLAEGPQERERLFGEAATVWRPPPLTAHWGLVDDRPEEPPGEEQTKGHGSGAVAPLTGRPPYHSGAVLGPGECAKGVRHRLPYSQGQRLLVLHDRAEPQQGPPIEELLQAADGRRGLTPPPAYAPARTPEERIGQ